jgi:hypothetical protein
MVNRQAKVLLLISGAAGAATTISLIALPFYGLLEPNNKPWPFDVIFSTTAISPTLSFTPSLAGSPPLAYCAIAVAVLTVELALLSFAPTDRLRRAKATAVRLLTFSSTALLVLMVVELLARPPFGAGPRLQYSWGAVVGVVAAAVACMSAWSARILSVPAVS